MEFTIWSMASRSCHFASVAPLVALAAMGCADTSRSDERVSSTDTLESFEQFERSAIKDEQGVYIIGGDSPVDDVKKLREVYDTTYSPNRLIANRVGTTVPVWTKAQRLNLSYCVSDTFGGHKARIVRDIGAAAAAWAETAGVKFVYLPSQDATCTASNANVLFDVRPTTDTRFGARAFFPGNERASRNILVSMSALGGSQDAVGRLLLHELGHTLGFRHEHIRPEAGTACPEDTGWAALTGYDPGSVMHYPSWSKCKGKNSSYYLSASDVKGAQSLYGAPGGGATPEPTPQGKDTTDDASGTLKKGETAAFGPIKVTAHVKAVLSGTGDADLYLRFGSAPTANEYACRPNMSNSEESCDLDVPAGATELYVSVYGFTEATYKLTVTYR